MLIGIHSLRQPTNLQVFQLTLMWATIISKYPFHIFLRKLLGICRTNFFTLQNMVPSQ